MKRINVGSGCPHPELIYCGVRVLHNNSEACSCLFHQAKVLLAGVEFIRSELLSQLVMDKVSVTNQEWIELIRSE
jgi:hypothetical protein